VERREQALVRRLIAELPGNHRAVPCCATDGEPAQGPQAGAPGALKIGAFAPARPCVSTSCRSASERRVAAASHPSGLEDIDEVRIAALTLALLDGAA
jgi:hypothetical protein